MFLLIILFNISYLYAGVAPIDISAQKIKYFDNNKMARAIGNVVITYKTDVLRADTAIIDMTRNTVLLYGRAKLTQSSGFILESEKIVYYTKTQKGYSFTTRGFYKPWHYFAEMGEKISDSEIYVSRGGITTCNETMPHYYFYATKMKIYPKDKIVARNVLFVIDDLPIFYLPFTVLSLRQKSAFWQVTAGYSRTDGYYLKNRFRLFDEPNYKLLYFLNGYSVLGSESKLEGSYKNDWFYINSDVSWLTNSDTFDNWTGKTKTKKNALYTRINNKMNVKNKYFFNAGFNYSSSQNYLSGTYLDTNAVTIANSEISSFAAFNSKFKNISYSIYTAKKYYWAPDTKTYLPLDYTFPNVNIYISNINILRRPRLSYYTNTTLKRYKNIKLGDTEAKITVTNTHNLNNTLRFLNFFTANTLASYYFNYAQRNTLKPYINRYNLSENINFRVGRYFNNSIAYTFSQDIIEDTGFYGDVNSKNLTNSTLLNLGFLRAGYNAGYDFLKDTYTVQSANLRLSSNQILFQMNALRLPEKDKYYGFKSISADVSLKTKFIDNFQILSSINLIPTIGDTVVLPLSLGINLTLRPTKNWRVAYQTSFSSNDVNQNPIKQINQSFSVYRDLHCWEMELNYRSFIGATTYEEWWLRFKIKQLQAIDVKLLSKRNQF